MLVPYYMQSSAADIKEDFEDIEEDLSDRCKCFSLAASEHLPFSTRVNDTPCEKVDNEQRCKVNSILSLIKI